MVGDEEVVLVCSVQLALVLIVVLDLLFDFLQLLPLMVVDLFEHQLLQFHPGIHAESVVEDVLVGTHCCEAGAFGHEKTTVLVIEAWREHLNLIKRNIFHVWLIDWHLLIQAIEAAEYMIFNALHFLPKN